MFMRFRTKKKRPQPALVRTLLVLTATAAVGGCAGQRALPPPVAPYDYRDRHPVVLANAPHVLDVFPSTERGRVDAETMGRVQEFAGRYKEFGYGQISVLTPAGGPASKPAREDAEAVRRALASFGLGRVTVIGSYPVADANLAAPVRLTFQSLKAKVANRCGEWPRDLASGSSVDGWQNETYWNFGCASQATLSAQVADPRDFANPRGETPSDVEMRMRAITKLRGGNDPSTNWRLKGSDISTLGSGGL